jgi:hypothetical protein
MPKLKSFIFLLTISGVFIFVYLYNLFILPEPIVSFQSRNFTVTRSEEIDLGSSNTIEQVEVEKPKLSKKDDIQDPIYSEEYRDLNEIFPESCELGFDFEDQNNRRINRYDCEDYFDEDLGFYIFPNKDEYNRCSRLLITYQFAEEMNIEYIALKNIESNRNFQVRHSFRILETYVDPDFYGMVSLYPERTNKVQYFDVFKISDIYFLDVIQIHKSEDFYRFGFKIEDAKNECAFEKITFYGNLNNNS